MNKQDLAAMVAEILGTMDGPPMVKATEYHSLAPEPEPVRTHYSDGDFVPDVTSLDLRNLPLIKKRDIAIYGTTLNQIADVNPPA